MIRHIAAFFSVLGPNKRTEFLEILHKISKESDHNWRFRHLLARFVSLVSLVSAFSFFGFGCVLHVCCSQLATLVPLYPSALLASHFIPLSLDLLNDKFAAVREATLNAVCDFFFFL